MSDYTHFDFSDDEEDYTPSYTTWVSVIKEYDGDPILDEAPASSSRTSSEDYFSLFYADQEASSSDNELPYPTLRKAEEEEEDWFETSSLTAEEKEDSLETSSLMAEEEEDPLETSSLIAEEDSSLVEDDSSSEINEETTPFDEKQDHPALALQEKKDMEYPQLHYTVPEVRMHQQEMTTVEISSHTNKPSQSMVSCEECSPTTSVQELPSLDPKEHRQEVITAEASACTNRPNLPMGNTEERSPSTSSPQCCTEEGPSTSSSQRLPNHNPKEEATDKPNYQSDSNVTLTIVPQQQKGAPLDGFKNHKRWALRIRNIISWVPPDKAFILRSIKGLCTNRSRDLTSEERKPQRFHDRAFKIKFRRRRKHEKEEHNGQMSKVAKSRSADYFQQRMLTDRKYRKQFLDMLPRILALAFWY